MKKYLLILFALCLMVSLTACGNKEEEGSEGNKNESSENRGSSEEVENDVEEQLKTYELYSDSTKMVFKNGTVQLVYYYSGDKITAHHSYTDCGTAAAATYALSLLEKDETMDKAYTDGKYLIIEYAKSEYENLSAKEIRALYSYMEQIQDKG